MLIAPFVYYLKSRRFHFCHYVDSSAFTSMDEDQWASGTVSGCMARIPGSSTKGFVCSDQLGMVSMASRYYENFRATKFNNPPCLYNVTSTSFSNEAITLNTFPVLVLIFSVTPGESSSGNAKENVSRPDKPRDPVLCPGRNWSGATPIPIRWSLWIFS